MSRQRSVGRSPIAPGSRRSRRQLRWFDRAGRLLGGAGEEGAQVSNPTLSPDGRHVVVMRTVQRNLDLWLLDLQRNVFTRLTDAPGIDSMPVWAPDGDRLVFNSSPGETALAIARVDRMSEREGLPIPGTGVKIACDGRLTGGSSCTNSSRRAPARPICWPCRWVTIACRSRWPRHVRRARRPVAPDGKWVAYESDESGRPEIYVQPFPGPGRKVRVSLDGGSQVRWRRDGKELFYLAADESLMAVSLDLAAGTPAVGVPAPLFKARMSAFRSISRQQYVVSPDGQRFLIATSDEIVIAPITLLLNWKPK